MRRFRRMLVAQPEIFRQGRILVVTQPQVARDVLAFKPHIFEESALLGPSSGQVKAERAALRSFTDEAVYQSEGLTGAMRLSLRKHDAVTGLMIASLDTFAPLILGERYPEARDTIIKFMLIRINDQYLRNTQAVRARVSRKFYACISRMASEKFSDDCLGRQVASLSEAGQSDRTSRILPGIIMGVSAPAVLASSWLLYEKRRGGALEGSSTTNEHTPDDIIKEVLRLHPPSWCHGRRVIRDGRVAGHRVYVGDEVLVPVGFIQSSSRYWDRAEEFQPQRWHTNDFRTTAYMPFSIGSRACVSARLALHFMEQTLQLSNTGIRIHAHRLSRYRTGPLNGPPNFTVGWSQ